MSHRDGEGFDERQSRAERRLDAAQGILRGRFDEFIAMLRVGCEAERWEARNAVIAAQEAVLDRFEDHAWIVLERAGIDPTKRHH